MQWINPKYAGLVADYQAAQDASDDNVWADRPDARFRKVAFVAAAPPADDVE